MTKSIFALLLLSQSLCAFASEQSTCTANKGAYITGTVVSAPKFASASTTIEGVKLTHTRLNVRADQDGKTYDVAIGNVYAVDHVKNASTMPPSLAAIKVNQRLGLCGKKYTSGTGIHWVHSNCGEVPTTSEPNGWVKVIASSGSVSASKTRSQNYCYLWD
ncbi:hypothetical protein [Massilia pseudoviolaceinigra]|uniref:hypothetical protein n=1 Tax=Massilia pseudoviolaceinigra TaxID=3057165 RepID=UPI00279651EE|nr:hypothetical protein [Massilia sp. CCM 9206]MDQ1923583.1 hypothetical protein [Massilia sp. CCM 9206]